VTEGLLLAVPLGSLLLRLAVALAVSSLLVRLLDLVGLRSPRARVLVAVSPFVVTATVALLASGDPGLPSLLAPTAGAGTLAIPVEDRYLDFAPRTVPWLLAAWPVVTGSLLLRRLVRSRGRRSVLTAAARPVSPRTAAVVARLARDLEVAPPRTLAAAAVPGGAALLGVRSPVLILDERLLGVLDDAELEGVLAHELAHLARRDNLVAWFAAAVGDVVCFLPGAAGAMRRLRREREAAADQLAVEVTGRPAALASGLLRALDLARPARGLPHACAALVEPSGIVRRVRLLVDAEAPSPVRHRREVAVVAVAGLLAVAAASLLPTLTSGPDGRREALAVLLGSPGAAGPSVATEGRVFDVYRRTVPPPAVPAVGGGVTSTRDLLAFDRPGSVATCRAVPTACSGAARGATPTLRPDPIVLTDVPPTRWQAIPVLERAANDGFALFWLARLDAAVARVAP
jgi:Zn-dependent protease with chaperone function